jgi:hypothetical protein
MPQGKEYWPPAEPMLAEPGTAYYKRGGNWLGIPKEDPLAHAQKNGTTYFTRDGQSGHLHQFFGNAPRGRLIDGVCTPEKL